MMSAIGMLGTPSEMYRYGSQFGGILFSYPVMMYSVIYWYFPVFWKLEVSTSYEVFLLITFFICYNYTIKSLYLKLRIIVLICKYLEWRFNRGVRMLCSVLFTVQMMLYMAIVVYAPALAIAQGKK